MNSDFLCERRLEELNPQYNRLVKDTAFLLTFTLEKYKTYFPEYTDHTISHSLNVLDFCNKLIGQENIDKLNVDEIYVLLMGIYLHDSGMGVSEADYKRLKEKVAGEDFIRNNPDLSTREIIRSFHQEFSAEFIKKYSALFDIPSQKHVEAIVEVSRGHRKSDLYNNNEYPADFTLDNGNTVCLPYLASLVRLADEMDVAADRNSKFEFPDNSGNIHIQAHAHIKMMNVLQEEFVLWVAPCEEDVRNEIESVAAKLQETLDLCRNVIEDRTKFTITQKRVVIKDYVEG